MYLTMYRCMCVCVCVYVCMSVYVCICMYVCMHVCMHLCMCVYACTHASMYVCLYNYVHMYDVVCMPCMYAQFITMVNPKKFLQVYYQCILEQQSTNDLMNKAPDNYWMCLLKFYIDVLRTCILYNTTLAY